MSKNVRTSDRDLRRLRAIAKFQAMMTERVGSLASRPECVEAVENIVDKFMAVTDAFVSFDGSREGAAAISSAAVAYIESLDAIESVGAKFTDELRERNRNTEH
jgi:hypothetical protein